LKVVYNDCFGRFHLSTAAIKYAKELGASPKWLGMAALLGNDIPRNDPILVKVVEVLGDRASGEHAYLQVATIPAGIPWRIETYDGKESVMTVVDYDWQPNPA
jgi:hypothetical protein